MDDIEIYSEEGLWFLNKIENDSVSLKLTDPPDTISHKSEMDKHYNDMKENEGNDIDFSRWRMEWI